ncbi:MAG: class I SAM-dependent methyltransferase [Acidobacteria bacterium]|nr:class I SAM-dependent methyltransferase [Acidobacteriota bacterium]
MKTKYDPVQTREFFDRYAQIDSDWDSERINQVSSYIHCRYLRRYVKPGDRVFDAGAGIGRYTVELAKLGAEVTVGDISPAQLEMNRERVQAAGYERSVVARTIADIVDLSQFTSGAFDAVVCYGGAISYVEDRADDAIREMLRVVKPGGYVLLDVGAALGSTRLNLREALGLTEGRGPYATRPVFDVGRDGYDVSESGGCRLYKWAELEALLKKHDCAIVAASADIFLSSEALLDELEGQPEIRNRLLQWEVILCREKGVLDAGRSIIVALQRTPPQKSDQASVPER